MVASGRFSSMLKSIGDNWFGCSREFGCFSEGLLRKVLLYVLHKLTKTLLTSDEMLQRKCHSNTLVKAPLL